MSILILNPALEPTVTLMAVTQVVVGIGNQQQLDAYQDAIEVTQLESGKAR